MTELDVLLDQARAADPSDRILLRDAIAAHGDLAIEAMTDWLGDPRLGAFSVRVLERIGHNPSQRRAVVTVLGSVDPAEFGPHLAADVGRTLSALTGGSTARPFRNGPSSQASRHRPQERPGVAGRGYWVMRTSPGRRPYIWAQARRGRLRQGWGWTAEQNLDVIAETIRKGGELSEEQQAARRSLRMRTGTPDGIQIGDIVIAPNLPDWGSISVFRVVGSYEYRMDDTGVEDRFGHILPVELLAESIDRRAAVVSDALRMTLGNPSRMWNITPYGGDVERMIGNDMTRTAASDRWGEFWSERDYETLFGRYPPNGERPSADQVGSLAAELGRSIDAIAWQWGDGKAYCGGGSASTTSDPLKAWLDRTGACRQ